MKSFALLIMIATLIEALIEYGTTIFKMVEEGDKKTALKQCIAIVLGIFLSFSFNIGLFNCVLVETFEGLTLSPILDKILTGILISRGANYLNDVVSGFRKGKLTIEEDTYDYELYEDDDFEDEEFLESEEDIIVEEDTDNE